MHIPFRSDKWDSTEFLPILFHIVHRFRTLLPVCTSAFIIPHIVRDIGIDGWFCGRACAATMYVSLHIRICFTRANDLTDLFTRLLRAEKEQAIPRNIWQKSFTDGCQGLSSVRSPVRIVQDASAIYTSVSRVAYLPRWERAYFTGNAVIRLDIAGNETREIEFYILI